MSLMATTSTPFLAVQQPEDRAADASESVDGDSHDMTSLVRIRPAILRAVSSRR